MKATYLDPTVGQYMLAHTTLPDDVLDALAVETRELTGDSAGMQISPDQGRFLTMIAQIHGAANAVEVGTFTGYSSICLARGLAPGGRLTCFDVNEEWTAIARRYWERAEVTDRVELRIGPAAERLRELPEEPAVDLAFIDADKANYTVYYEILMSRLAPGGLILVDNTLWSGHVADPTRDDDTVRHMREFNDMVSTDGRVTSIMLPIADGLTMIRKH
ncbi:caffeoyl-CoA O-methyltransferase [Streptosporangium becharense]|uniref:Caffeoyl-CoA O-methyltransferase n=1 Tax=Streptosporangium becharense TaxID=1816182 RepID=A0A7W9IJJ8_9ACTN|nr:O-methyltransferase [Streptosporangium becharense]MBB2913873.1 caffeoyl-CoA O-methyltransferase [Streptosporangium becharense]MBB5821466.1 caffeoyl-CoA O-methyltransferase [Streptosporangium becharense]